MLPLLRVFLLGLGVWLLILPGRGLAQSAPPTVPGVLVFRLRPSATASRQAVPAWQKELRQLGATAVSARFPLAVAPPARKPGAVDLRQIYQARYPATRSFEEARARLLQTGEVDYVEPLYQRQPLYQPNDPYADSARTKTVQYYLKNVRAYRAWDISQGDTNIVIGILDTGTRFTHQDLKGQEKCNYDDPIDGIDNDQDGFVDNYRGWDMADNDNDPTADATVLGSQRGHGIAVTGVAAASTDNKKGIAGLGFRCRYLPIKIYPSTSTGVFAGYEAIVYAADHGCQVINLSWGGIGGKSQYEQDIINYAAINRDVVIVAAAGNTNAELDFYPASYDHVLSVATASAIDTKSTSASFSYRVDLVAPGVDILTTSATHDSAYASTGGSSLACPLVAAAAALVRTRFPDYTAEQVAARLQQTTDSIYTIPANAQYRFKLGTGRLNVLRALTTPTLYAVQLTNVRAEPVPSFQPGDTTRVVAELQNLLAPVENLRISLSTASPYLRVLHSSVMLGSMVTLSKAANALEPFALYVLPDVPQATTAVLRFHFEADNGYQADQFVTVVLNPGYIVLNAGQLDVTVTAQGNLGYEATRRSVGEGVSFRHGPSLLSLGGLMVATAPNRVSARLPNAKNVVEQDFTVRRALRFVGAARGADQEISGVFADSLTATSVGVRVRQQGYAWSDSLRRNYVVLEYTITNATADTLRPLYAGLYMDWDLPLASNRNTAEWDATRNLSYVYDRLVPALHVGVQLLKGGPATTYAVDNNAPGGSAVRLADGFSDEEKFLMLSSGTSNATAGQTPTGADVSHTVGTALAPLAPGDSVLVAFALLGASSLDSLRATADIALQQYNGVVTTVRPAAKTVAWQVYPNPATGALWVEVPASFAARQVTLLDVLGREVQQWPWVPGQTRQRLVLPAATGVYFLQMSGAGGQLTRKVLLRP